MLAEGLNTSVAFFGEWAEITAKANGEKRVDFNRQGCDRELKGTVGLCQNLPAVTQAELDEYSKELGLEVMVRIEELANFGVLSMTLPDEGPTRMQYTRMQYTCLVGFLSMVMAIRGARYILCPLHNPCA